MSAWTDVVSVSVPQLVTCRFCRCEFVIEVRGKSTVRSEVGGASAARNQARAEAAARAARDLSDRALCTPVPCPGCLRYQPFMARQMARDPKLRSWLAPSWALVIVGAFVAALGLTVGLVERQFLGCAFTFPALGLVLIFLGGLGISRVRRTIATFDPDTEPEGARRRKAKRASTADEYEQKQVNRARRSYEKADPNARAANPLTEGERLFVVWWVRPIVFATGGTVTILLSQTQFITFTVPERSLPGVVLGPSMCPPGVRPFKLCACAFRVHPDEYQHE